MILPNNLKLDQRSLIPYRKKKQHITHSHTHIYIISIYNVCVRFVYECTRMCMNDAVSVSESNKHPNPNLTREKSKEESKFQS